MTYIIPQPCFDLVAGEEQLRLKVYPDIAGIPTIGYGHRLLPGETYETYEAISAWQAGVLLRQDLQIAAHTVTITTGETDPLRRSALISLCFNIGTEAFASSTIVRLYRSGAPLSTVAPRFLDWDKAHVDGQLVVSPGLLDRRKKEQALFFAGLLKQETTPPQGAAPSA